MTTYAKNRKRMTAERFILLHVEMKQAIRLAAGGLKNRACNMFPALLEELYEELKYERDRLSAERKKRSET